MNAVTLVPEPLTRIEFSPFGEVIETTGRDHFATNFGFAERFHRLASIDCHAERGEPIVSVFSAKPWPMPIEIKLLERHPISSQAFVSLTGARFLIVVAESHKKPTPQDIRAFVSDGRQGINYGRGTWHHPLLALSEGDFLIIDRAAPGPGFDQDYEEISFEGTVITLAFDGDSM